jgi:hypothetical protein
MMHDTFYYKLNYCVKISFQVLIECYATFTKIWDLFSLKRIVGSPLTHLIALHFFSTWQTSTLDHDEVNSMRSKEVIDFTQEFTSIFR